MKITIWDILTILLLVLTAIVLVVVVQIFSDPNSGINPFPPPTMPSELVLPTYTNTPLRLPSTWTPAAPGAATATVEPPVGLRATSTLLPTATRFVVDTWTPTTTSTRTPTITRTPTNTQPPTSTKPPFAVTSVGMAVDTSAFTGPCPPGHIFTFLASISVSGSGTVKYHWIMNDGSTSSVQSLDFSNGGTQSVSTTIQMGATGTASAQIYIDEPNHQSFGAKGVALTCSP